MKRYPFLYKLVGKKITPQALKDISPIIVGGMPGSGTRVIVWLLRGMGAYMGGQAMLDSGQPTQDSIPIAHFIYMRRLEWILGRVDQHDVDSMIQQFTACLDTHLAHYDGEEVWGWKNPPNMLLLDFFHALFPRLKYIHVVRDGRDTGDRWIDATVNHIYKDLIPEEMRNNPDHVNYMWLWSTFNNQLLNYCEENLEGQYMMLRMEDAVNDPEKYGNEIKEFIGAKKFEMFRVPAHIHIPETIGRHRKDDEIDPIAIPHMETAGKEFLIRANYVHKKKPLIDLKEEEPIVVGGFGGSGTRVPVLYLLAADVNMLYDEEMVYEDRIVYEKLVEFGYKWGSDALQFSIDESHLSDCITCMEVDRRPWGWKNPSHVLYLDTLHKCMPNMKFIHITRDPRDIANKAMAIWVDMYVPGGAKNPEVGIPKYWKLWAEYNDKCYEYGTKHMGNNYLHVRLEDLIPRNKEAFSTLSEFAGVNPKVVNNKWWNEISTTHEIGTRIDEKMEDFDIPKYLKKSMKRFGYEL